MPPEKRRYIKTGVPQGDTMSTAVFCIALEKALRELKNMGYILVVYCDDLIIAHKPHILAAQVT